MMQFFKATGGALCRLEQAEPGCWVSVCEPTKEETDMLTGEFGLDAGFVRSCLDDEESSRIEREEDQTLIIVDTAVAEKNLKTGTVSYSTIPLGIITAKDMIFTVSTRRSTVLTALADGVVPGLRTDLRTRFVLQILMRISAEYVLYLKQIEKISNAMEQKLSGAMKNAEIVQLMGLEKSLVYFTTSLKADLVTIEKIQRGRAVKLYPEDEDLLEDVGIEFRQATEMAGIYSGVLSAMMDAFSYVIANNQNAVMWRLTIITVIIEVPNIIYGFYGINTDTLPFYQSWVYPFLISVLATVIATYVLLRRKKI